MATQEATTNPSAAALGGGTKAGAQPKPPASESVRRDGLRFLRQLIGRYLPGQQRLFWLALLMLMLESGAAVAEAWPIARLIDVISGKKPQIGVLGTTSEGTTVLFLAVVILALAAVTSLCDSLAEILLARAGRVFGFNVRNALFARLQRLSLAFHDRRRTGDVLTRVTSDVDAIEDFVIQSSSDIVGSVLTLVFTLAVLRAQSAHLVLIAVVIVPLLIITSRFFSKRIRTASKRLRSIEGEVASSAQEMLGSIRVIQTYGRAGYEERRFEERNTERMSAAMHSAVLQAKFSTVVSMAEALVVCAVVWQGSRMVQWGDPSTAGGLKTNTFSTGDLVFSVALIQNMFKPTRRIIKEWTTVGKVLASSERVGELLDRRPSVTDKANAIEARSVRGELRLDHVWFSYAPDASSPGENGDQQQVRPVLEDVSIHVPPGKIYALIGHTGAGKSTILQLLPRLYDVAGGSVTIDGHDVRDLTLDSLRANISVVLQETILFSGTVAENIAYGRMDATPAEIESAARQANAHEFIVRLPDGYDTMLGERGANLSGGQRQRIAIARAYVRRAPILLLDEPTTGLDVESSTVVLDALRTLMRDKTTIIVSHDLKLIENADQIVLLRLGRVEQQGTHESLLAAGGLYARLHGLVTESESIVADDESDELDVARWTTNSRQFFDRSLPSLAVAFDGDAMGRRLAEAMLDRRYELVSCKPGKAAYLPDGSCTLRYDLRLRQRAASTEEFGAIVLARVFARPELAHTERIGHVDELGAQARGHALLRPFRQPIAVLDDLGMLASAFPIDPDLPVLVPTTDGRRMRSLLGGAIDDENFTVVDVRSHPGHLNLGRQHRCVVRYDVLGHDAAQEPQRRVMYGKVADDDRGDRTVAALDGLWATRYEQTRWHDIRLPAVVLHRRDLGLLVLSEVTGAPSLARSIGAMVRGTARPPGAPGALDGVRHAARVAALIHSTPTELSAEKTIDNSVDELLDLLTVLSPMSESLATWLVDALDSARRDLTTGTPGPVALAHGDFTHTQLLFEGGSIALIDFDTVCSAEAAVDLGHFMAYLRLVVAKAAGGDSSNDLADALCAHFLEVYFAERDSLTPSAISELRQRAAAYEVVSLVRIAGHGWYKLKNERLFYSVSLVRDAVHRVTGRDPGLPASESVHA